MEPIKGIHRSLRDAMYEADVDSSAGSPIFIDSGRPPEAQLVELFKVLMEEISRKAFVASGISIYVLGRNQVTMNSFAEPLVRERGFRCNSTATLCCPRQRLMWRAV